MARSEQSRVSLSMTLGEATFPLPSAPNPITVWDPLPRPHHPDEQSSDAFVDVLSTSCGASRRQAAPRCRRTLAMPGPFDYADRRELDAPQDALSLWRRPRHALAERFGWQDGQVRFLNDAAAYLLGENSAPAQPAALSRAVGITLGTGIGSAFAVDGSVANRAAPAFRPAAKSGICPSKAESSRT